MLNKHLTLIQRRFIKAIEYRSEMVVWMVLDTLPLLVLFLVWIAVFAQHQEIKGYSLTTILQYYFLGLVINGVTSSHYEAGRVNEIRNGKIDYFLIRPLSYLFEILWGDVGAKLVYFCFLIPFYLVLAVIINEIIPIGFASLSVSQVLVFGLLLLYGYLVEFLLALIIVMAGFWIEGAEGLEHFKWILVTLFSGWMIPISMMPEWMKWVVEALPFKYMYALPIGIVQGTYTLTWFDAIYALSFVVSLYALARILWRFAIYKYASAGG